MGVDFNVLTKQNSIKEQVNEIIQKNIEPNRLGVKYKEGFVNDVLSLKELDSGLAERDQFAEDLSLQQEQHLSSFLEVESDEPKNFDSTRRRSQGVYVPKSKVDEWVGRKSDAQTHKTLQLLNQESSEDRYNIEQSPKIVRDPRKTMPQSELLKMHSSSSVEAAQSFMKQKTGNQTPQDGSSPIRTNKVEIINVDDSNESENENEAFPSERISDIRGPRKSDYKVSTPAIKESEQNSFNYSTQGQQSHVSVSSTTSKELSKPTAPLPDPNLPSHENETEQTPQKEQEPELLMPSAAQVDLIGSTSDLFSETTVFADQSSRLINEQEQSGLDTSKTMLEKKNPLLTGEEDNILEEVELEFDENEDMLLEDFENDMNSFVMRNKDVHERLKSVKLSHGGTSQIGMSKRQQNELDTQEKDPIRKITMVGDQSHLKDLEDQFSDMQFQRNKTLGGASEKFKTQYLRQDSETEESVRLGSLYLKASAIEVNQLYDENSEVKRDGSIYSGANNQVRQGTVVQNDETPWLKTPKSDGGSVNFDAQLQAFEAKKEADREEDEIFAQMERAVMMEREKILRETDAKLARVEKSGRDSFLKGRGISLKLNIDDIGLGKQKSEAITEQTNEEDDLLNDDLLLDEKIGMGSFDDAMLVTEQNETEQAASGIDVLDSARLDPSSVLRTSNQKQKPQSSQIPSYNGARESTISALSDATLVAKNRKSNVPKTPKIKSGDSKCSKCRQNTKYKKQLQEKAVTITDLKDKLASQERETQKAIKERNELLEYVELLEQQIEKQNAEIETLKSKDGKQEEEKSQGPSTKKYFEQVLEVVEEDGEDDIEDY